MAEPSVVWDLSSALGVVPQALQGQAAALLDEWWTKPRTYGCSSAKRSPVWFVVQDSPSVFCTACAVRLLRSIDTCCVCHRRGRRLDTSVWESAGVTFVRLHHPHCAVEGAP